MRLLLGVTVAATATAFLREQVWDLVSRGHEVHLVASFPTESTPQIRSQFPGAEVHRLRMVRDVAPHVDFRALFSWLRLVSEIRPDVAVFSTPKAALLGMCASKLLGVPVRVFHVRGLRFESLSGISRVMVRLLERVTAGLATHVLCDSPSLRETLASAELDVSPDKLYVLGMGSSCGVNISVFRPPTGAERAKAREQVRVHADEVAVGFVGRITEDKGIGEFLICVRRIKKSGIPVRGILAGAFEGSARLQDDLKAAVDEGLVSWLGRLDQPRALYWALDVFFFPSRREGFPIAPLEAQACGVPIVTTTATGCRDAIAIGRTGLLAPAGDVQLLSERLQTLVGNAALRHQFGSAGVAWVRNGFSQRTVVPRFSQWLESVSRVGGEKVVLDPQ